MLHKYAIDSDGQALLKLAMARITSARAYDRILKVARTIADPTVRKHTNAHLAAINYRNLTKKVGLVKN